MKRPANLPFVASIFLSAFLLFLIQPVVTQFLLPRFGGSPAVWNTALVFFQVVLLLGYIYAHWLARLFSKRVAALIHMGILAAPLAFLPPALPTFLQESERLGPTITVLAVLALMVGMPFFVLSTNSSLIQHWWAQTELPGAEDPYWLYGTSNFGSLLALLSYPFLVGPILDLETQVVCWSVGYAVFVVLTLVPLGMAARTRTNGVGHVSTGWDSRPGPESREGILLKDWSIDQPDFRVSNSRVFGWVARAAVASSLLLSLTMRITMDVGSVPLFWVLPLAVYLITFILAFGITDLLKRGTIEAGVVLGLSLSLGLLLFPSGLPFESILMVGLGTLFFGGLLCHHDLAEDRPDTGNLTRFYLWISVGGALGGVLNSLLAPVIFNSVAEYPLTLIALALLLHARPGARHGLDAYRPSKALGLIASVGLLAPAMSSFGEGVPIWGWGVAAVGVLLWGLGLSRYVGSVVVTCLVVAIIQFFAPNSGGSVKLAEDRSFFGVVRVTARGETVTMSHGTTVHGLQNMAPELRGIPLSYYHPSGPMGSAVGALGPGARVGVVGLGTGALAALIDPSQEIVFHEIDPLVVEMAREHFTYLRDSAGSTRVVLGDGRLTLGEVPDGYYDLLVLDAYSSDLVPIHLLTTEALRLYLSKTRPDGLVLLHLSNRHVDLLRVMKGASVVLDTPVLMVRHRPSTQARLEGASESWVAAMARTPEALEALDTEVGWGPPDENLEAVVWTDSKASILSVLR